MNTQQHIVQANNVDLQLVNAWMNAFNKAHGKCIFADRKGIYSYCPIRAKDFAVATGAIVEVRRK